MGPQANLGLLGGSFSMAERQSLGQHGNTAAAAAGVGGGSSINTGPRVSNTLHGVCLSAALTNSPPLSCPGLHTAAVTNSPPRPSCPVFAHAQARVPAAGGSGMQPGSSSGGADNTQALKMGPRTLVRDCVGSLCSLRQP